MADMKNHWEANDMDYNFKHQTPSKEELFLQILIKKKLSNKHATSNLVFTFF
jgi:hypothetical protein